MPDTVRRSIKDQGPGTSLEMRQAKTRIEFLGGEMWGEPRSFLGERAEETNDEKDGTKYVFKEKADAKKKGESEF